MWRRDHSVPSTGRIRWADRLFFILPKPDGASDRAERSLKEAGAPPDRVIGRRTPGRFHVPFALAMSLLVGGAEQLPLSRGTDRTSNADLLAGLKRGHPRLLVNESDWEALRQRQGSDSELARAIARILTDAEALRGKPPLEYKKDGRRLLDVSRQAIQRVSYWAFAFHLTGDEAFARRAKEELLHLSQFPDWNPSHFLDTAEMTTAFALGYDWLYQELDPSSRDMIRQAIMEKGLLPGSDTKAGYNGWQRSANNWNQVCFGGLTLGALAIGDEEPEAAERFLQLARAGIAAGLRPYAPDGVYPEGPGYWGYGTLYQTLMLSGLRSALNTQWNLDASPGFLPSAEVQLQLTGPFGRTFNFFDCGEDTELQPAMFWFARRFHQPELLRFQVKPLKQVLSQSAVDEKPYHEHRLFVLVALWWSGLPEEGAVPGLPLVWHGDGENPVGVFRSSWKETNALYLAFKGGSAGLSHGHMDAGSFVLDCEGVRWAIDLGRQDYLSIESKGINLWSYGQESSRWRVFRLNNFSHNTLTIDNQLHRVGGAARIIEFHDGDEPHATLDLSPVFEGQATRVLRTFQLTKDRTVSIRDELSGLDAGANVRWALVTRADVQLSEDRATLTQDGRTLGARVLSPAGAAFSVIPADPPDDGFNAANPNTRILTVNVPAPESGRIELEVTLTPGHDKPLPQVPRTNP